METYNIQSAFKSWAHDACLYLTLCVFTLIRYYWKAGQQRIRSCILCISGPQVESHKKCALFTLFSHFASSRYSGDRHRGWWWNIKSIQRVCQWCPTMDLWSWLKTATKKSQIPNSPRKTSIDHDEFAERSPPPHYRSRSAWLHPRHPSKTAAREPMTIMPRIAPPYIAAFTKSFCACVAWKSCA